MNLEEREVKALDEATKAQDLAFNNWGVLREQPLVAIAYGKLTAFLLVNDHKLSTITFIEDYTKEINEAIQEAKNREEQQDLLSD